MNDRTLLHPPSSIPHIHPRSPPPPHNSPPQLSGSFKYRGAYNRVFHLSSDEKERGVVAFSSGNFAQGLACASEQLGVPCTIVMPADAPTTKMEKTRAYGAEVVLSHHSAGENREIVANALAKELSENKGLVHLHPFDDELVRVHSHVCSHVSARGQVLGHYCSVASHPL